MGTYTTELDSRKQKLTAEERILSALDRINVRLQYIENELRELNSDPLREILEDYKEGLEKQVEEAKHNG